MEDTTGPKEPFKDNKIYMSIDHLKKGIYSLNILEKDKVIKLIKIRKQ